MLTQKARAPSMLGQLRASRITVKATSGGSSDTDVNDPTVSPAGAPSWTAVTTATPVGTWPMIRRKWPWSTGPEPTAAASPSAGWARWITRSL